MMESQKQICQNCSIDFEIAAEDFSFYQKMAVPPPTFCWQCRLQRRLVWRNERHLYKRSCDLCQQTSIMMYAPEADYVVYCPDCWRSDNWDPLDYGQEYDWERTFFDQYNDLLHRVPRTGLAQVNAKNSPYANFVVDSKDAYLSYSVIYESENVYFSKNIDTCKDIYDSFDLKGCTTCYECNNDAKNFDCYNCWFAEACISSQFLYDCSNCQNCTGCINLRNKSYCIFNEQYSKEEYEVKVAALKLHTHSGRSAFQQQFLEWSLQFPRKYARAISCVDSTGDDIFRTKNVKYGFSAYDAEDCKYIFRTAGCKDVMDGTHLGYDAEMMYEFNNGGGRNSQKTRFTSYGMQALNDTHYVDYCGASSYLFGCVSIRSKQHCILNRQYSQSEYEDLVPRIIQHMHDMPYTDAKGRVYRYGEFVPIKFSPFAYNETMANSYFPMTKEEVAEKGYRWRDPDPSPHQPTVNAEDLPDSIHDVDDSILDQVIACAETSQSFKLVAAELAFYRQKNLPLPRYHPNIRHKHRLAMRNPLNLWQRTTDDGIDVMSAYSPDRPERILSEEGYQQEVM